MTLARRLSLFSTTTSESVEEGSGYAFALMLIACTHTTPRVLLQGYASNNDNNISAECSGISVALAFPCLTGAVRARLARLKFAGGWRRARPPSLPLTNAAAWRFGRARIVGAGHASAEHVDSVGFFAKSMRLRGACASMAVVLGLPGRQPSIADRPQNAISSVAANTFLSTITPRHHSSRSMSSASPEGEPPPSIWQPR